MSETPRAAVPVAEAGPVPAPTTGQVVTIETQPGQTIALDFDPTAVQVATRAGDLVLDFPNGGEIRLVGFVAAAAGDSPPELIDGNGTVLSGDALVARLGAAAESEVDPIETAAGPRTGSSGGGSSYDDDLGHLDAPRLPSLGALFNPSPSFAIAGDPSPSQASAADGFLSTIGRFFSSLTGFGGGGSGAGGSGGGGSGGVVAPALAPVIPTTISVADATSPLGGDNTAGEGSVGDGLLTFQISLSQANSGVAPITVYFALQGTATPGTDYSLPGAVTAEGGGQYSIEIPPGATTAEVILQPVIDGPTPEGTETVVLTVLGSDTPGIDVAVAADGSLDGDPATGIGSIIDLPALMGGPGNDRIVGTDGDDIIIGGAGNDRLFGRGGNDTFRIGLGDGFDRFDGGAGDDRIEATANGVAIGIAGNFGPGNSIETISANGFAGVTIQGDGSNNTLDFSHTRLDGITAIDGGAGNDRIIGSSGNDIIIGGAGNDRLSGGDGNDIFRIGLGDGFDRFDGSAGDDRIEATANGVAIGIAGNFGPGNSIETISANGFAGVTIQGDGSNNTLDFSHTRLDGITAIDGGAGNDRIIGSSGNDIIIGGAGNDTLTGGDGADIFSFDFGGGRGGTGRDVIRDFKLGDGDVLRFTSVLDHNLNGPDLEDLSQAISRVADNGRHVTVTFIDGGSLTLQGLGTGAITSVNALFDALGPHGVEVV